MSTDNQETVPFLPFPGRLIVRQMKEKELTEGGIALPQSAANRRLPAGKILAAGRPPEKYVDFIEEEFGGYQMLVGRMVLFPSYTGEVTVWDKQEYILLPYEDVAAIIHQKGDHE